MYALDFCYDNKLLSSFGFIICQFDASAGMEIVDTGVQLTFNKVPQHEGRRYILTNSQYDSCITSVFHICKNPDITKNMEITAYEYRELSRWLNRKEFLPFYFCVDKLESETVHCEASFNLKKIEINGKLFGLELSLETNRPFGYGDKIIINANRSSKNATRMYNEWEFELEYISDEIGYIYPNLIITCNEDADLEICNKTMNNTLRINNCSIGEIIYIDGENQIITSSKTDHKISNDFNFEFIKLGNTYSNKKNIITVNSDCNIEISYNPIIKDWA